MSLGMGFPMVEASNNKNFFYPLNHALISVYRKR